MQNDGIEEETIVEWWDNIPYELKIQKKQNLTIKLWKYILNILIFGIN
jgi:hypothetical protein